MNTPFSIREAILFGWVTTRAHSAIVFQVVLTLLALQVADAIVQKTLVHSLLGGLASTVLTILTVFVSVGAMIITLKLARGEEVQYREIMPDWRFAIKFTVAGMITAIVSLFPLIVSGLVCALFIVATGGHITSAAFYQLFTPMYEYQTVGQVTSASVHQLLVSMHVYQIVIATFIMLVGLGATLYLFVRLSMVRFAIIDGSKVVQSLRDSRTMTQGVFLKLLVFLGIVILLNIFGTLLFLVGVLVTLPVSLIAYAYVYDKLKSR